MKFPSASLLACGLSLALSGAAWAQFIVDNADWKESDTPTPPSFDISKLVQFKVSSTSSLVYGVDPASIRISQRDGLVRYVIVALSSSGASNVMYEALRCSTAQVKTYARYSANGGWRSLDNPEWISLYANMPSRHALAFAKAGACDNTVVPDSVNVLVKRLKDPNFSNSQ